MSRSENRKIGTWGLRLCGGHDVNGRGKRIGNEKGTQIDRRRILALRVQKIQSPVVPSKHAESAPNARMARMGQKQSETGEYVKGVVFSGVPVC